MAPADTSVKEKLDGPSAASCSSATLRATKRLPVLRSHSDLDTLFEIWEPFATFSHCLFATFSRCSVARADGLPCWTDIPLSIDRLLPFHRANGRAFSGCSRHLRRIRS